MGFSAMLAEEYILMDISLICRIMVRLAFATSMKIIQHQHFSLSLVTGLDVTQNISTAESPGRCVQYKQPLNHLKFILTSFVFFFVFFWSSSFGQQVADTGFNYNIKNPIYKKGSGTVITLDEAHFNF